MSSIMDKISMNNLYFLQIMGRKRDTRSITIDPRIWDVAQEESAKDGISVSRWLENYLFDSFRSAGLIPRDAKRLGEHRGGDRKSQKDSA